VLWSLLSDDDTHAQRPAIYAFKFFFGTLQAIRKAVALNASAENALTGSFALFA